MNRPDRVAVVGFGVNNRSLVPFFLGRGRSVIVADRRPRGELVEALGDWAKGVEVLAGPHYLQDLAGLGGIGEAYLTPGMKKDVPEVLALKDRGVRLTCETDLVLKESPAPVVGITGSAGKTTTTTLIGEGLRRSGVATAVGGNIGRSLLGDLPRVPADGVVVLELSSFQLELVERSPQGAVWLNLAENHLDIHGTMEHYAGAKQKILRFQDRERDWAVLPDADPALGPWTEGVGGRRYTLSLDGPVARGAYLDGGRLYVRRESGRAAEAVADAAEMLLPGRHNLYNFLAATMAVVLAGGTIAAMGEVARTFAGVPHRLERVRTKDGVTYINDSIATAPDRTAAALSALTGPLVLILGGYDKHLDYTELGRRVAAGPVRAVVLLGATREKMRAALAAANAPAAVREAETFEEAVLIAHEAALPGDTVLLSPAAASYDLFRNFEERGQRFRDIVQTL